MPNTPQQSIENNFVGGLKTEFTGLNFPENACTDADNCIFSIIGDVNRRGGINYEANFQTNTVSSAEQAINTYKWNNVGGDGETQIVVTQIGSTLEFYLASSATNSSPLSSQLLGSLVNISSFVAIGGVYDSTVECSFADGNGYLFVFHPNCDPFYCTYNFNTQTITATVITVQIRDFLGIPEAVPYNFRPTTLTPEHNYNLNNQGWGSSWLASSTSSNSIGTGTFTFVLNSSNLPIVVGQTVTAIEQNLTSNPSSITGTVVSYVGNVLVFTETANVGSGTFTKWIITPGTTSYLLTWYNVATPNDFNIGANYPSNADVWWQYRNTNVTHATPSGKFDPAGTGAYVVLSNNQAPQGAVILPAFVQDRSAVSNISGLTPVTTTDRPSDGCWFQGRIFYTGLNASFQATGDAKYYTWTESIYFSQIITQPSEFGYCYQQNDPTNPDLFDLLPSDGGVIVIQGSGAIYKLFPVQNGLLVFAANGIWFITGSQGIGFAATDYTVTKISGIQSISRSSYVNVLGWPLFWNEEGIYQVEPSKQGGGLVVNNLCLGTILSFYNEIPLQSKKYARGDYNPITFVIQWIYRSTNETDTTSRYQFDSMLNLNTYKAPFYPYTISNSSGYPWVSGINYVAGPGGSTSPDPIFKYFTIATNNTQVTFSEENDFTTWTDWDSVPGVVGLNYVSTFTTGYKLHGSANRLWQMGYIWMYSDNSEQTSYTIRGLWDYGTSGTSGKWSTRQLITNNIPNFGKVARKIRIRGHGLAMQIQVTSVTGLPFNIEGWSTWDQVNQGI
jgi:hypothetical protein